MDRLHEIKVDGKRWKIVKHDNECYNSDKIIDKENGEIYDLIQIIGIEQVAEDEFLVYQRANLDCFEMVRYKLQDSKIDELFDKKFNDFYFISDDRIMFTYRSKDAPYRCGGIYSIKENKMLEEGKWLDGSKVDVYKDDDNSDKIKICVEEYTYSYELNNPKLLFTVDPNTLQPNSVCYSQLRDSYIKVSSKEDLESIKSDEEKYISVIEEAMFGKEYERLQKAKTKILSRTNETK